MAPQPNNDQFSLAVSDIGVRMRELEERTNSLRDRILLLSKNIIDIRNEIDSKIKISGEQVSSSMKEFKKISREIKIVEDEISNFVRKDEIILVERMLKDFQPLEFVRTKDLEEKVLEIISKKEEKKITSDNTKEKINPKE